MSDTVAAALPRTDGNQPGDQDTAAVRIDATAEDCVHRAQDATPNARRARIAAERLGLRWSWVAAVLTPDHQGSRGILTVRLSSGLI
jgi:hypothetical protein